MFRIYRLKFTDIIILISIINAIYNLQYEEINKSSIPRCIKIAPMSTLYQIFFAYNLA
jgi:hypothetical protein